MTARQKEIFDKIEEIKDRLEDAKGELTLLKDACEQLKREKAEAIERAEKAERRLSKVEEITKEAVSILADAHDEEAGCSFTLDIDADDSDVGCLACLAQIELAKIGGREK